MRHRNEGLRKRCPCPRNRWPKCPHPWHFNFKWKEVHYRLSLDRETGRRITSKTEAQREADRIRHAVREGGLRSNVPTSALTFRQFADIWKERRGSQLVRPRDNSCRLEKISAFVLPGMSPPVSLGDRPFGCDHH